MTRLREICAVLGQRYTMEIIVHLRCGSEKYLLQIAEETEIPYTTIQKRVADMEDAGLITTWRDTSRSDGKAIKMVKLIEFNHVLTPLLIKKWLEEGRK